MFAPDIKIMICDDSVLSRRVLKLELGENGYNNIIEAQSGMEAINLITNSGIGEEPTVDLLFLDIVMPGIDGVETAARLKKFGGKFASLPIIIVSAEAEKEIVIKALSLGVNNYVIKPFVPGAIIEKMQLIWKKLHS